MSKQFGSIDILLDFVNFNQFLNYIELQRINDIATSTIPITFQPLVLYFSDCIKFKTIKFEVHATRESTYLVNMFRNLCE